MLYRIYRLNLCNIKVRLFIKNTLIIIQTLQFGTDNGHGNSSYQRMPTRLPLLGAICFFPSLHGVFPALAHPAAPLLDHAPGATSHYALDYPFLTNERSESLRAWLAWEESSRIWVQSLINDPLTVLLTFNLPQSRLWIIRVGACGNESTVVQNLRSRLPGSK